MARAGSFVAFFILAAIAARPAPGQPVASAVSLSNGLHAFAVRESAKLPDPFPIRRVLLADGAPLPVAPDGDPFQRMPRDVFERLVRTAARNLPANPKLLRADYRATFSEDSLAGTGEWLFASDFAGSFALDSLKLAVRGAKWSDGRDARLSGSPSKLWIERAGRPSLAFAWSARGGEEPGVIHFNLGVPAAPLAVLDLDLPADRVPSAKGGVQLAGPIAKPGNRAAWRILFGGDSSLEFSVRHPSAGRPPPLATASRHAKVDLAPGLATIATEFEIAPLRDAPTTLEFFVDDGLAVSDVSVLGLANWRTEGNRLTLAFREAFTGGKIAVAAVAALPADGRPWPVRGIVPANGVLAADLIDLSVGPDLKWDGCSPGDYRTIHSATSDRGLAFTFRGTLPADGQTKRRPPNVRVGGTVAEFATVETIEWRIEPDRTHLTARIRATVARGPLARLVVRVPPGATPPSTVVGPDDPTAALTSLGDGLWAIEPTLPVPAGETLDVRLEMRGPAPNFAAPDTRASLVLAAPSPVGATKRDGTATVTLAPVLRGWSSIPSGDSIGNGELNFKYSRDLDLGLVLAIRRTGEPDRPEPAAPKLKVGEWRFADLAAAATVDADGTPRVEFSGRIRAAAARTLPVTLPAGAVLESTRIDGKWTDPANSNGTVSLPVPEPDADGVAFVLAYRLATSDTWVPRLDSIHPGLPGSPPIVATIELGPDHRTWPALSAAGGDGGILVPTIWLHAIGFGFAALILGFAVGQAVRGPGRLARPLAFFLAASLGAAAWLAPAGWLTLIGPPLAVSLVGLIALHLRPGRAAVVALAFLPAGAGVAQAPAPVTVYFLGESPDDPNRLAALVPRSTLDRLAALSAPQLPAAMLTDAEYSGAEVEGGIRFDAAWRIDVSRAGTHEFDLPLAGVKLEGMTLDGSAAFPDASKPGRYRVVVAGVGPHVLKASFAVPTTSVGGDRETRLAIPDHPSSRVVLALPLEGREPEIVGRNGARSTATGGGQRIFKADIGSGTALAIRRREAGSIAPLATAIGATVWDVNEMRAEAVAAFLHRVEGGAISRLEFDLPAGLEPGQFAVREIDSGTANGLKDWTLEPTPAGARLTLVLRGPARGLVATTFRLVPRDGPTARPALAVPRCLTGDSTASYLGVRFNGVAADAWQIQNYLDVPADAVGREFAAVPEIEFDRTLARSLRREGPNPAIARPTLRVSAAPAPAVHEMVWNIGPRAEVAGSVQWTGTGLPVAECDLPNGIAVAEVVGGDLAGWERAGNRLRIWFKSDVRDPSVKWLGHWPAFDPAKEVELPSVAAATVRVRPVEGVSLAVSNATVIKFLPNSRARERAYVADPAAVPKFRVHLPVSPILGQSESLARIGNFFEHRALLELPLAANRPHAFTLTVSNLPPGAEARIEWPAGAIGVETGGPANRRTWLVDLAERAEPVAKFVAVTRFPVRPAPELPAVELLSANVPLARSVQLVALPDDLRPAPGSARRAGNGWTVIADGPIRLVDVAPPGAIEIPPVVAASDVSGEPTTADRRAWFAVPWLAGFLLLGGVARWGSARWRPELLLGFGFLATAVAGWVFAAFAIAGLSLRVSQAIRAVGRRVIR